MPKRAEYRSPKSRPHLKQTIVVALWTISSATGGRLRAWEARLRLHLLWWGFEVSEPEAASSLVFAGSC